MEKILEQLRKEFNFSPDEFILCSTALKIIERVFEENATVTKEPDNDKE